MRHVRSRLSHEHLVYHLHSLLLQPLSRLFVAGPVQQGHDFPYALIVMLF